ncbi:MAG: membrane dipeptidase, partial [Pseudomonadota bacterium]
MVRSGLAGVLVLMGTACAPALSGSGSLISEQQAPEASAPSAATLHDEILTLDAHLDTPALFHRDGYDFSKRGSFATDRTNVDLPRLQEGQLDGGFWVIYTAPGPLNEAAYIAARTSAILRQASIRELAAKYADSVELAFEADDAARIHEAGKVVV